MKRKGREGKDEGGGISVAKQEGSNLKRMIRDEKKDNILIIS